MKVLVLTITLLLASCTPLDFVKTALGGGSGPSLEVETTVGDKKQEIQMGDEVTAETVEIHNELDYWLLIIAIVGWVAPTPQDMAKAVLERFSK